MFCLSNTKTTKILSPEKYLLYGILVFPVVHVPQDGLRLLIQFANHGQYELDANTLDEKNKVIGVLY